MSNTSRFVMPYQVAVAAPYGVPGAQLFFYLTGTNTPTNTYSDPGLTHANSNPVVANAAGLFPNIFMDPNVVYKVVLEDATGAQIWTADPYATPAGGGVTISRCITYVIDGGGSVIATGIAGALWVPFSCTIQEVTLLADRSGSAVVDIWKAPYGSYPPNSGGSIVAADPPTIAAAQKGQDSTLTGWTTAIAAGDTLIYNVNSASTIQRLTVALLVQ